MSSCTAQSPPRRPARGQAPLNKPSGRDPLPLPQADFRWRRERRTPDARQRRTSPAPRRHGLTSCPWHSPSSSRGRKVWKAGGFKDSMNTDSTTDSCGSSSSSGRWSRLSTSGRVLEGSKTGRFGQLPSSRRPELLGRITVGSSDTDGPRICVVLWGPRSRSC